jgi:hypothetical protein
VEELSAVVARAQAVVEQELRRLWPQVASGDLGQVERLVQQALRRVGSAVVEAAVAARAVADERRRPCCGQCGQRLRLVGRRLRVLQGLVGEYRVRRAYYQCRRCKGGAAPLDAALGLGSEYWSPGLAQLVCRLGIESAFVLVPDLVQATLGIPVDEETVRRLVERVGAVAEVEQTRQATWRPTPTATTAPALLLVSVDGVLVPERDGWHEAKVGRLAALGPPGQQDAKTGRRTLRLGPSRYCVGLEEAEHFWPRVARAAVRCGLGRGVRTVVLLADGAEWIWLAGRTQLALAGVEVVEIVDYYHACEHVGTVASAVFSHSPRRRQAWLVPLRRRLRDQGAGAVLRALAKLRPQTAVAVEEVRNAQAYFTTHAARMAYPTFAARQFPIGSGAIESTCRHLVQLRAVQAGMRWRPDHLQGVLSLRALQRSGGWAAFWASLPLWRSRTQRHAARVAAPAPTVVAAQPSAVPVTGTTALPPVPTALAAPASGAPTVLPGGPASTVAARRPWQGSPIHRWRLRALARQRCA